MKKIIFVCQVFYPDTTSTSQLFTDLLKRFANDNRYKVIVISGFPAESKSKLPAYEKVFGIDIYRCGMNIPLKKSYFHRAVAYLSFLLHASWKLLFLKNKDVVFGVTNPPFLLLFLSWVSRIGRFDFQYMLLDVYPEGLIRLGKIKEKSLAGRIWKYLNRRAYERAKDLIVLGRDMSLILKDDYQLGAETIHYIPHWSAAEISEPICFENNPLAKELEIENKFVVQYSGNMGVWHDINIFVRLADALRNEDEIHFLFIGDGIKRRDAEKISYSLETPNITWLGFQPQEYLPISLTCCHIALISQLSGLEGVAVPCKLYGVMASGRAIMAQVPAKSEVAMVVKEDNCGFHVNPGDLDGLIKAILYAKSNRDMVAEMGRNAFDAYQSKYTLSKAFENFKSIW